MIVNVIGYDIGLYFLGDSVYFFFFWLMKFYLEGIWDLREIVFNKEFLFVRVKVECVFGVLKSRWRIFFKWFDSGILFVVCNVVVCVVLYNICIRSGDEWEDEEGEDDCDFGGLFLNVIWDGDNIREVFKDFF